MTWAERTRRERQVRELRKRGARHRTIAELVEVSPAFVWRALARAGMTDARRCRNGTW